jgi:hypothetical protein
MKKILSFLILTLVLSFSSISMVHADGFMHIYDEDKDVWELFSEEQQFAIINHKHGMQHMLLTVHTGKVEDKQMVWVFPVPATPDKTAIDVVNYFPKFRGYEVKKMAKNNITETLKNIQYTQIYTFPLFIWRRMYTSTATSSGINKSSGINVHERIEKMGVTTELISAENALSLKKYIDQKNLHFPDSSQKLLDEYIGKEYSFVVSWVSDKKTFKQKQGKVTHRGFAPIEAYSSIEGDAISIYITFPTKKIFFPLKPTSIYGSKKVPANIYVLGHVTPTLYPEIEGYTQVDYFSDSSLEVPDNLKDFFIGHTITQRQATHNFNIITNNNSRINNLLYTKIKIAPPSKFLTQDVWIEKSAPLSVSIANVINTSQNYIWIPLLIILSLLTSVIAGIIIFRHTAISKISLALLGLFNVCTLFVFSIAVYFWNTKKITAPVKTTIIKNLSSDTCIQERKIKHHKVIHVYEYMILFWILGLVITTILSTDFLFVLIAQPLMILLLTSFLFFVSTDVIKEYKIKIFNFKRFLFIFLFTIISSTWISFIFSQIFSVLYIKLTRLANDPDYALVEFFFFFCFFLVGIKLSTVFDKKLYSKKWLYCMHQDKRKKWFVLLFSLLFISITSLLQLFFTLIF